MDMVTIIKNSVGKEVTNKLTHEVAKISGVDGNIDGTIKVYVTNSEGNFEELNFIQFVSKYNLDFTL